jgi:type I restriction enzyme M protein
MMIKGNNPENIRYGSTLATDEFSGLRFDFMLSNPPYGKSWKTDQGQILEKNGANTVIIDPRFEVRLPDASGQEQTVSAAPAVDDGQLLFLMEMVSKMKRLQDSPAGSRIATVHNGSALFTGNAGGGASNIRQYLIENDLLEAIIQLPNNIFYNTGITTYIWLLSNKKAKGREGKVQLIDASQLFEKLRKNLGAKNCAFTGDHISQITRAYLDLLDTGKQSVDGLKSQVFDNKEFGYWKVTVERPLRKSAQFTAERIAPLRFDKSLATEMEWIFSQWGEDVYKKDFLAGKKETVQRWLDHEQIELTGANLKKLLDPKLWLARRELLEIAGKLQKHFGDKTCDQIWNDFTLFTEDVRAALKKLKLKPGAPQLKTILDAVSWRDPEAAPIVASELYLEIDTEEQRLAARTRYPVVEDGNATIYEPDSELRDTENIPLTYEGGIEAYFHKEVLPHVSDAWIDDSKTVIGYEISFNKYFYVHQPLRDLAEVVKEIRDLEAETEGLLEQILSFSV